jgi:hypothetical protein
MSAKGQLRRFGNVVVMSAHPPIVTTRIAIRSDVPFASFLARSRHFCFAPESDL